jgi:hypothetical protein
VLASWAAACAGQWRHDDKSASESEDAKRELLTAPEVAALFGVDPTAIARELL